ncbi:MAG TPA: aminotransferase class I/II-fold pyridoxal phosphate-dependent enzyme [Woeseiaceae bacterium]|nr:aminotransferase class I/II-fold pyridoxal phosphate-dependent enzyme [Woeseiaceae bacterium]
MEIERFQMERTQCLYENEVKFNLSESGVWPLTLEELLPDPADLQAFAAERLRYPHSTGRERLRSNIARFYGASGADCVTVTNGGSEANYMTLWGLVGKSDRVAFMVPNYLQGLGISNAYGRQADTYRLVMQKRDAGGFEWRLDRDSLKNAVKRNTKVIVVTNPNNPTGAVLDEDEMNAIVAEASRVRAWILADEIYRGAEVDRPLTPTFAGRYDKVIITGGLSKAFALPGLRTGWVVAPPAMIRHLCQYHDYLTLTPSFISDYLADVVMQPARRDEILARTRRIISENLPPVEKWVASHADVFDYARPRAGAILTLRYRLPVASEPLFNRFRKEQSVLITPGAHFGIGKYIRIGFGYELQHTLSGLKQLDAPLRQLAKGRRKRGANKAAA